MLFGINMLHDAGDFLGAGAADSHHSRHREELGAREGLPPPALELVFFQYVGYRSLRDTQK
jgi:hypothetical protein